MGIARSSPPVVALPPWWRRRRGVGWNDEAQHPGQLAFVYFGARLRSSARRLLGREFWVRRIEHHAALAINRARHGRGVDHVARSLVRVLVVNFCAEEREHTYL